MGILLNRDYTVDKINRKKTKDEFFDFDMVPYESELVAFCDHIINKRIALGRPTEITNESHWQLVEFIIKGWSALYPEYTSQFFNHMKSVRASSSNLGVSREGEAMLQHQLEIPKSLFKLIEITFPKQKWSKVFNLKFAQRFSGFMGADKL